MRRVGSEREREKIEIERRDEKKERIADVRR